MSFVSVAHELQVGASTVHGVVYEVCNALIGGLFPTSRLKTLLEESVRLFPAGCDLGGEGVVDYHMLADGGFAQTTRMQRLFEQPKVANDMLKAHFNECFSS
ncbi:unnamed protein product [Nippostrongylus brasiliensis]|uniref:DDE Tnp4 domain-containing protein n=1 Tax=Nippostrongylus brasiliensis TaxID=27835 RepID=A0A0N4YZ20_NIPBR|nr:unnamed protein product [Nippostrongylus brasiliensis]